MSIVHTDNIKENMCLSSNVIDMRGHLLLAEGMKIQSNHIRILKIWGITEVEIVGEAVVDSDHDVHWDQKSVEKDREDLTFYFKHSDLEHPAMKELFRLAHSYRSRPSSLYMGESIDLDENVDSLYNVKPGVSKRIMQKDFQLPELPAIVFELNEILDDPRASADDIVQIVFKSPSLTAVLLKIVNSSFYGLPSKIDSISRAVTILGTREIGSLAFGVNILSVFDNIPKECVNMSSFLRHSFACGIISRILAAQKQMVQTEQFFVSGLLHDIGRLVIYKYFPDHANAIYKKSVKSGRLLFREEKSVLGCRHTDIGKLLVNKWNFSSSLENNISCHHTPSKAQDVVSATIVHLADLISNALGFGSSGERYVPSLDYNAWDSLGISPSCFEVVAGQAAHQLSAVEFIFQRP